MTTLHPIDSVQRTYLDDFMNQVSRSFALVVPFLEDPLRDYVAAAYLICRVIDNIEDCQQPPDWKSGRFHEIHRLLAEPGQPEKTLQAWGDEKWPGLTPDQVRLMSAEYGTPLWQIYGHFPAIARDSIQRWAGEMASGMERLEDPAHPPQWVFQDGVAILSSKQDYDDYCYIVAGTVGHMVTELAAAHYRLSPETSQALHASAEACGRGLQKTNILKDFRDDLERGVSYLPYEWMQAVKSAPLRLASAPSGWKRQVVEDILHELDESVQYLNALPLSAQGYRMSGLLSLLPALQTVYLASRRQEQLFTPRHQIKISRATMAQCVADAQRLLFDNAAILEYSRELRALIQASFA